MPRSRHPSRYNRRVQQVCQFNHRICDACQQTTWSDPAKAIPKTCSWCGAELPADETAVTAEDFTFRGKDGKPVTNRSDGY